MHLNLHKFCDIQISPFHELLDNPRGGSFHRGGPIWDDWDQQDEVRHQRSGRPVDHKPPPHVGPVGVVNEKLVWCGPICGHYGHQVADFSSRILAYKDVANALYCFAAPVGLAMTDVEQAPHYLQYILEWFGVPKDKVLIVNEPVTARELYCSPQMEQVGVGPKDIYIGRLVDNQQKRPVRPGPRGGKYFISRAGMAARFAGESYMEYLFTRSGYRVVRPETLSLQEQIDIYRSAHRLVFSEGSAVHTLQLLGSVEADVHVLERRPGANLAHKLLRPRVSSLTYWCIGALVHGLNANKNPAPELGINVPVPHKLKKVLSELEVKVDRFLDDHMIQVIDLDLREWILREKRSRRASPESLDLINRKIRDLSW